MTQRKGRRMQVRLVIFLFTALAGYTLGREGCGVYDDFGNKVTGSSPVIMGTIRKGSKLGTVLQGELRLENVHAVALRGGICGSDYLEMDTKSNRLRFVLKKGFTTFAADECVFSVELSGGDVCLNMNDTEIMVRYLIRDAGDLGPRFAEEDYVFEVTFPVSKGNILNDVYITVLDIDPTTRVFLKEPHNNIQVISVGLLDGNKALFQLKATKLIYRQDDLTLTLVTINDVGPPSEANITLRLSVDSDIPRPNFEKGFYEISINVTDLDAGEYVFPDGVIRLDNDYSRLSFELQRITQSELSFGVIHEENSRNVGIKLSDPPMRNITTPEILLLLKASITDIHGRRSESSTALIIRFNAVSNCSIQNFFDPERKEDLTVSVIVLGTAVVVLLFVIIYLYFKYVLPKKSDDNQCQKCKPVASKQRRPTPRKISDYTYPLDKLPPPMETLAESAEAEEDVESEANPKKTEVPPPPTVLPIGVKTRKRSITFRDTDAESRQNREAFEIDVTVHKNAV